MFALFSNIVILQFCQFFSLVGLLLEIAESPHTSGINLSSSWPGPLVSLLLLTLIEPFCLFFDKFSGEVFFVLRKNEDDELIPGLYFVLVSAVSGLTRLSVWPLKGNSRSWCQQLWIDTHPSLVHSLAVSHMWKRLWGFILSKCLRVTN